jgi:sugar lactone lactonase YvrE
MLGTALLMCVAATALLAQQASGNPTADSVIKARSAWARAGTALQNHDEVGARREIEHAAASWPVQPAYLWASAVFAAHARDTTAALTALERYAALGLGHDFFTDSALSALTTSPVFAAVSIAHRNNRAPIVRSRVFASMRDSAFWPEGMDYDQRTHQLFVASVRHRTIAVISADGATRYLWKRDRSDLGAMLGVRVDTTRGVLWATTSGIQQMAGFALGDTAISALLRIRISDGVIEQRWNLPAAPGGHVLGDLAVGRHGDVFVTDSNEPVLYRLRPGASVLEGIRSPLFHSLQGMAPTPDGRVVYVADYSVGLLRVDLATSTISRIADAPSSTTVGCDGIAWDRGSVVAVQNGVSPARIMRFQLDASGTRIQRAEVLDRNSSVADEPTIGAVVGREFVYVANSQWDKHDDKGRRIPLRPLTAPVFLAVPLPR